MNTDDIQSEYITTGNNVGTGAESANMAGLSKPEQ